MLFQARKILRKKILRKSGTDIFIGRKYFRGKFQKTETAAK